MRGYNAQTVPHLKLLILFKLFKTAVQIHYGHD